MNTIQRQIIDEVIAERARAERLCSAGKFPYTTKNIGIADGDKLAIIMEEVGELAKSTMPHEKANSDHATRKELIQICAACLGWLESIEALSKL